MSYFHNLSTTTVLPLSLKQYPAYETEMQCATLYSWITDSCRLMSFPSMTAINCACITANHPAVA